METVKQTIEQVLHEEVLDIGEKLKAKHISLGMRASGKWIDSVEVMTEDSKSIIRANDYTRYLTNGRSGGSRPPISALESWVKVKLGLSGKEALSTAFAVAKKIEKEGTNYYPQGTDLVDGVITESAIRELHEKIGELVGVFIAREVQRDLEKAFS